MRRDKTIEDVASKLLEAKGLQLVSSEVLQTLWAGYGHICSLQAVSKSNTDEQHSLILKYISPPLRSHDDQDEGHMRKIISYQVEQYFYTHLVPKMSSNIATASCLSGIDAHDGTSHTTAMVLTDLREKFPIPGEKRGRLTSQQTFAALEWLARFHGFWWKRSDQLVSMDLRLPPVQEFEKFSGKNRGGVWLNGGYTYLATRISELEDLVSDETSKWSSRLCHRASPQSPCLAQQVASILTPSTAPATAIAPYQTLIHGDVKSENLFINKESNAVAFYDFQYVGLGLGACDLAKFFTCSVPNVMLLPGVSSINVRESESEKLLLQHYLKVLEAESGKSYPWPVFLRHWQTALVDWLRFQASWGFWGNTKWLETRVRNILDDQEWMSWLENSAVSIRQGSKCS